MYLFILLVYFYRQRILSILLMYFERQRILISSILVLFIILYIYNFK